MWEKFLSAEDKKRYKIFEDFFKYYFNTFLKKDVVLHNLNKMNLLTSMPLSSTYQQVVLGKINQRKIAKGKENKINSKQSNMKEGKRNE